MKTIRTDWTDGYVLKFSDKRCAIQIDVSTYEDFRNTQENEALLECLENNIHADLSRILCETKETETRYDAMYRIGNASFVLTIDLAFNAKNVDGRYNKLLPSFITNIFSEILALVNLMGAGKLIA